jgi:proteic killer suppression protein
MIKSFKSKALADLFETGKTGKIDVKMHKRILVRLDRLEASERPEDMNLPGFDFHALKGFDPTRYTVHVNGPWSSHLNSTAKTPPASISSSIIEADRLGKFG